MGVSKGPSTSSNTPLVFPADDAPEFRARNRSPVSRISSGRVRAPGTGALRELLDHLVGAGEERGWDGETEGRPDLNPIEQLFAKLKHLIRKAEPRTIEATWRKAGDLLDLFSPAECVAQARKKARR